MNATLFAARIRGLVAVSTVAGCVLPTVGQADELPARKAGLWEVSVRRVAEPLASTQKVLQCTDRRAERVMLLAVVPGQEHCHEMKVKKRAQEHEVHTTCYVHDNRVDASVRLSGDFRTFFRGSFDVRYSKPVRFDPGRTEFEGRWLGACTAGQRVGDMVLPNGATVNVVADRKRAESQGHVGHNH